MRKPSPALRGLAIACAIFAVIVTASVMVFKSGVIDRIPSPAGGEPVPAAQTPGPDTIPEGTWTVGKDIQPGTYRAAQAVGKDCFWRIVKSGTNGADILAADIPGGGRPSVTLEVGQDFVSSSCGTWVKE